MCPHNMFDPLGHHAVTCRFAGVSASIEAGSDEHCMHTRPADVLLPNWVSSKPAALDFTVVTSLGSAQYVEAGTTAGSAALSAEGRKHANNDQSSTGYVFQWL